MVVRLVVKGVSFSYGSQPTLDDVTMEVAEGEVVGIVGPNGAGKSTLLKCIDRILQPKHGAVLLDGREATGLSSKELARALGYVPQATNGVLPFTVFEAVLLGRRPYLDWGVGRRDVQVMAEVLSFLGIETLARRHLDELSGGEKQKVLLARALAQEPEVLLLDEPTSNLDIKHQLEVLEIVREFAGRGGRAAAMVPHDLNLASRFSDKIVMLQEGRVFAAGAPERVLTAENIGVVYGVKASVIESAYGPYVLPIRAAEGRAGRERLGNGPAGSGEPACARSGLEP